MFRKNFNSVACHMVTLQDLLSKGTFSLNTQKMLQQILDEMWIDPELLAELDESQKQTLFCKMREEQIRRWRIWDEQNPVPTTISRKPGQKHVDFLLDAEGDPWTWVMGEHEDDKSIETILEEEAREAARQLAEKEAHNLRLTMEAELTELLELNKKQREEIEVAEQKLETEDIYCSADQLRINFKPLNAPSNINNNISIPGFKRDALQEISFNKPHKVSQRVAQWEIRMMEERTSEIYKKLQKKKMDAAKEAEEAENKQEHLWREQQRKAKEAETQMREIARRAREEHRRSMLEVEKPNNAGETANLPPSLPPRKDNGCFLPTTTSKPPNKDAILEWFRSSQVTRKAGLDPNTNSIAPWFHGLITRQEAESLLLAQPAGSFLVRVSERIWGYAISYRDIDRCKHYLIDASNGHYQFLGTNQISHNTLGDLVTYHGARPITAIGGELLGRPCHRIKPLPPPFQALSIRAR
ncbi:SH2 domain-containing protein 4B-like isoform X3 [Rhodnius prolixus]|uniref:SH2 domain-containing protein 4B-like isoform X3 n=1 Tax=Rhodnius prolixus TaxID=13249 RepID=UPI003D18E2F1